jgi:hypothetical protein
MNKKLHGGFCMTLLGLKSFKCVIAFQFILTMFAIIPAFSDEVGTNQDTFILSDETPGNLVSVLVKAEYGNYNLYQALLQIQADANPTIAGIITPAFLNALTRCPTDSQIFTAKLNTFPDGSSLAISTDGTVQTVSVHANDYYNKPGAFTLLSSITGVGNANFVYSGTQPLTADFNSPLTTWAVGDTKYKVFAIASGSVTIPPVTSTPTSKKSSKKGRRPKISF